MGVAPAFRNIAGLVTQGIICPITAIVGDRFGNPVPQNTAVSFFTNGGVVGAQGLQMNWAMPLSEIKTGPPTPHVGYRNGFYRSADRYGHSHRGHTRRGNLHRLQWERSLRRSSGEFDPSDPEIDTPEPFIDHQNSLQWTHLSGSVPAIILSILPFFPATINSILTIVLSYLSIAMGMADGIHRMVYGMPISPFSPPQRCYLRGQHN